MRSEQSITCISTNDLFNRLEHTYKRVQIFYFVYNSIIIMRYYESSLKNDFKGKRFTCYFYMKATCPFFPTLNHDGTRVILRTTVPWPLSGRQADVFSILLISLATIFSCASRKYYFTHVLPRRFTGRLISLPPLSLWSMISVRIPQIPPPILGITNWPAAICPQLTE